MKISHGRNTVAGGIVSLGEVVWDVFPEKQLLGGAPLNVSVALERLGHPVAFISGVGRDARGAHALDTMRVLGVATDFVQTNADRATGAAIITMDENGNASYLFDRPAAFDGILLRETDWMQLRARNPEWVYYGTLAQMDSANEALLRKLLQLRSADGKPVRGFYDVNLRDGHWDPELVKRLARLATVLKMNEDEAQVLLELLRPEQTFTLDRFFAVAGAELSAQTICVTRGGRGCLVYDRGQSWSFEGVSVKVVDTVGAGDAFAAAFLHGTMCGIGLEKSARAANALGALVAGCAGATPDWDMQDYSRFL